MNIRDSNRSILQSSGTNRPLSRRNLLKTVGIAGASMALGGLFSSRLATAVTSSYFDVKDYGAIGDGTTDDTAALQAAVLACASEASDGKVPVLLFTPAYGYAVSGKITVPVGISVVMDAPLIYTSSSNEACLTIGTRGISNMNIAFKLNVKRQTVSDWSKEASIGIKLINATTCKIHTVQAAGFTIGLQCMGSDGGFSYNEIGLGHIVNNKYGVDCTNEHDGWCNENLFTNGRFSVNSEVNHGISRVGIRITSKDKSYKNNNNNNFYKPSFELNGSKASPGEALPIEIEHGVQNKFIDFRNEGNSETTARLMNESDENIFESGYNSISIDDRSASPSSYYLSRRDLIRSFPSCIYQSGPLHKNACYYDGNSSIHIPGISFGAYNNSEVFTAFQAVLHANYIEASSSSHGALGVFVDTQLGKRFVAKFDAESGYGGRIHIVCYDRSGKIVNDSGPKHPYVRGMSYRSPLFSAKFGGSYAAGSDSNDDYYFVVNADVQKIRLLFWSGTNAIRIRSFSLYSLDGYSPTVWSGISDQAGAVNVGTTYPTAGTWTKGKIVYNDAPVEQGSPGSKYVIHGWICASSGTPGTWLPMRMLTGN